MARTKDKLMACGHGSRHLSPYDGRCRRCVRESKTDDNLVVSRSPAAIDPVKVERAQANEQARKAEKAKREEEAALAEAGHAAA